MIEKINIYGIIKGHILSLKDEATGKVLVIDLVVSFIFPLFPVPLFYIFNLSMSDASVGAWVSAFSIFAGLLFNLLILIFGIDVSRHVGSDVVGRAKRFIEEIFVNVAFSILIAIIVVLVLGVLLFIPKNGGCAGASIFVYGLGVFVVVVLMILKRVHVLFKMVRGIS